MRRLIAVFLLVAPLPVYCHEVRPAYLELHEVQADEFQVLWKVPMRGNLRLALTPVFSVSTRNLTSVVMFNDNGAEIQTWRIKSDQALRGASIRIAGLEGTMTDALARIEFADGTSWTQRFTPGQPESIIPLRESSTMIAGVYLKLGIEHILFGIDHLLFVLALLIIAHTSWGVIKAITAFTVAHSITLMMSTLGFVHMPAAPIEAVIALSIVFLATEIIRGQRGYVGIASAMPWVVAFVFGLLHGFGFAGALTEIGLPEDRIPLALLFFNLGVETGQLLFIAVVLALSVLLQRLKDRMPPWFGLVPPYLIGTVATFWCFQRVATF